MKGYAGHACKPWDNKGARLSGVLVDKYYYYPLYYLGDNNLRWSEEAERMFLDHVAASPLGRSRIPGSSLLLGENWDLVESLIIHAVNPRSRLIHFTKDSCLHKKSIVSNWCNTDFK